MSSATPLTPVRGDQVASSSSSFNFSSSLSGRRKRHARSAAVTGSASGAEAGGAGEGAGAAAAAAAAAGGSVGSFIPHTHSSTSTTTTSSSSFSAASPFLSSKPQSTSTTTSLQTDPDTLLRTLSLKEVQQMQRVVQIGKEELSQSLKGLVRKRYADLLNSADTIIAMGSSAAGLSSALGRVSWACAGAGDGASAGGEQAEHDQHQTTTTTTTTMDEEEKRLLGYTSCLKYIQESPPIVWACIGLAEQYANGHVVSRAAVAGQHEHEHEQAEIARHAERGGEKEEEEEDVHSRVIRVAWRLRICQACWDVVQARPDVCNMFPYIKEIHTALDPLCIRFRDAVESLLRVETAYKVSTFERSLLPLSALKASAANERTRSYSAPRRHANQPTLTLLLSQQLLSSHSSTTTTKTKRTATTFSLDNLLRARLASLRLLLANQPTPHLSRSHSESKYAHALTLFAKTVLQVLHGFILVEQMGEAKKTRFEMLLERLWTPAVETAGHDSNGTLSASNVARARLDRRKSSSVTAGAGAGTGAGADAGGANKNMRQEIGTSTRFPPTAYDAIHAELDQQRSGTNGMAWYLPNDVLRCLPRAERPCDEGAGESRSALREWVEQVKRLFKETRWWEGRGTKVEPKTLVQLLHAEDELQKSWEECLREVRSVRKGRRNGQADDEEALNWALEICEEAHEDLLEKMREKRRDLHKASMERLGRKVQEFVVALQNQEVVDDARRLLFDSSTRTTGTSTDLVEELIKAEPALRECWSELVALAHKVAWELQTYLRRKARRLNCDARRVGSHKERDEGEEKSLLQRTSRSQSHLRSDEDILDPQVGQDEVQRCAEMLRSLLREQKMTSAKIAIGRVAACLSRHEAIRRALYPSTRERDDVEVIRPLKAVREESLKAWEAQVCADVLLLATLAPGDDALDEQEIRSTTLRRKCLLLVAERAHAMHLDLADREESASVQRILQRLVDADRITQDIVDEFGRSKETMDASAEWIEEASLDLFPLLRHDSTTKTKSSLDLARAGNAQMDVKKVRNATTTKNIKPLLDLAETSDFAQLPPVRLQGLA
ncbi:hypothetical protein IE81DRAFT_349848 [Ceraceosorus guamensis]|uniref:Uncharacterized protein n=1 Tax=Ceraceosorus guamensis TaxID=1522189 RepID=A0A316VQK6_9BASI|nr:hypothetical protein IE81DRAFT_349848 [Ceraceosorus guamensis]PWN39802.1 hypothetical protein IE81DRAFT_349848 [Ceraceosorus guamensis]